MWTLLLSACLFDHATYLARLAELTDDDGDGATEVGGDCDDENALVFPGATETCDGVDEDCDGSIDEDEDVVDAEWFADADADGFGGGEAVVTCAPPSGFVKTGDDCDDAAADRFPGAQEQCNGRDDDCNGTVDDPDSVEPKSWYADNDGDGFGSGAEILVCAQPARASAQPGDCDDADPAVNPGATEVCNGRDDDCNGASDDAPAVTWFLDRDEDGFGDADTTYEVCAPPPGYAAAAGDCDDLDRDVNPGAPEVCEDGLDSDCDGLEETCGLPSGDVDETDMSAVFSVSSAEIYVARTVAAGGDLDGDGYDDLVVARPGWHSLTGAVAVIPGGPELYLGSQDLDKVGALVEGSGASSAFGFALAAGDDTDGDGTGDLLVSALYEDQVYLFSDGAAALRGGLTATDATITLEGPGSGASFGVSVALLGDLDSDGFGDWIVGDYRYGNTGAAFLFYGSGASGTVRWDDVGVVGLVSTGSSEDGGHETTALGDLDGDGSPEFALYDSAVDSADSHHRGYIFTSFGGRLNSGAPVDLAEVFDAPVDSSSFAAMAPAGDLNGDGRDDAAFAAPDQNATAGAVYVMFGSSRVVGGRSLEDASDVVWSASTAGLGLGRSIAGVGDIDGKRVVRTGREQRTRRCRRSARMASVRSLGNLWRVHGGRRGHDGARRQH